MEGHETSGVTIHKLTDKFDAGDIVLQRSFPVDEQDTPETLLCKGQLLGLELLKEWLKNPEELWLNAVPQGEGEYWKQPTANDRVIDCGQTPDDINKMIRAYGKDGVFLKSNSGYRLTNIASCQSKVHDYEPGTILYQNDSAQFSSLIVATNGGILYASDTKTINNGSLPRRIKRKARRALAGCRQKVGL